MGRHPQGTDLTQRADQVLGHAVREVVLCGVAGEVLKRQHGNRADRRLSRGPQTPERRGAGEGSTHRREGNEPPAGVNQGASVPGGRGAVFPVAFAPCPLLNGSDKTVPAPAVGADEALFPSTVAQRRTDLGERRGEGCFRHARLGPNRVEELFLRDEALSMREKMQEHLDGFELQGDRRSLAAQLAKFDVEFELKRRPERKHCPPPCHPWIVPQVS